VIIRLVFNTILFCLCSGAFAQNSLDDIDLQRIPQKKVRKFILNQKEKKVHRFDEIKVSFKSEEDTSNFNIVNKLYLINENISDVWNRYVCNDLTSAWNGKMVSYGVSVSKANHGIFYCNDVDVKAAIGQVLFLNLRLMKGIYNLAVAFEITEIDPVKKIIVFNYVEGGKSWGEQILRFRSTPEGFTEIEHKTFFRSNSKFRDKRLYPFFHKKLIDEFHENVMKRKRSEG